MKVLIIAFGNPDNVISLSKAVSRNTDLTLLFVLSGNDIKQGILNINLSSVKNGLIQDKQIINTLIDQEISDYIGDNFKFWVLKTKSRKMFYKKSGISNFLDCYRASRTLKEEQFDLIHFNGISGFILYFLFVLYRIPKLWTLHDLKSHSGEDNFSGNILSRFLVKLNFHFVQHYKYLKNEFILRFGVDKNRVHQIYSGPFDILNQYKPRNMELNGKYILFSGRISKYKGVEILLDAFSKLSKKYPDLFLVIAGKSNYDIDLSRYGNNKNIVILNRYIENEELAYLFNHCLFVCTPYIDTTHSAVIMTSYAFYKPVVASNLKGLDEVVVDNLTGRLFESENTESLLNAMDRMLQSFDDINMYGNNIKSITGTGFLSWDYISNEIQKLYKDVILEKT